MSILNVEHLTHGFGDRAIFEDVSFRLLKGEHIGLVGANGEGKSTFMSIVTGKMMPDEGKVEWAKNVNVGYLDQHAVLEAGMTIQDALKSAFDPLLQKEERMNEICDMLGTADEKEMEILMEELGMIQDELTLHDFYTIDAKVEEVARALGLLDLGLDRDVTDLSGGQRTKVLLGKLLLEKPDILLLDEPTNYLDEEHIAWLKRYLLDYENAFILISHDIPFLNEVVNIIYHMENQELNRYVGDYDHFQEVYAVKKAQLEAAYRRQQQEINELKDFVARNKARVSTRNMAMSRQKKLDKMDLIELAAEKPKPEFNFRYGRTPGKMLFETKKLVIGYDEPLSKPLDFYMERGQKIALIGTNGIGKTTLLKRLIPELCALGLRPGLIKHTHHDMDVDKPGKDSYELRKAGAAQTIVASEQRWALMTETPEKPELDLTWLVSRMDASKLDLVLVEGFKHEPVPKILLFRQNSGHRVEELVIDEHTIAVASDVSIATSLPLLDLNDVPQIATFIVSWLERQ